MLDDGRKSSEGVVRWLLFFLDAVEDTAKNGIKVTQNLLDYDAMLRNKTIPLFGRKAKNALRTLEHLYYRPVINAKRLQQDLKFSSQVSQDILKLFVSSGILKEITGNKRNRLFTMHHYIALLEAEEV